MDLKKIKNTNHYLYDNIDEYKAFGQTEEVLSDWRIADEGDWVYTDDGYICQILKKSKVNHPNYKTPRTMIRTVCGSFICEQKSHKILGEDGVVENIYTFSGNYDSINEIRSKKTSSKKMLFAQYVAAGMDTSQAYSIVYPKAKDKQYIKTAANKLLQQKKVMEMVKQEIKDILNSEGVTPEYIIQRYKDIADISEKDSDKLRSLDALAKMSGLFDTEKKQEQLTVWTGFTPEQLEAIKDGDNKQKVLAHAEREE